MTSDDGLISQEQLAAIWYDTRCDLYEELGAKLESLFEELLQPEDVEIQMVSHRTKSKESFLTKAKDYTDGPDHVHDLCGLRVITYLVSHAQEAAQMLAGLLDVDEGRSKDKGRELGSDRVGYRSLHLVASLPSERTAMPEWAKFDGFVFEVQVTTILQHAWAEFEHDRGYKYAGGTLPSDIRRRLQLAAGLLEVADREFDQIDRDISRYESRMVAAIEASDPVLGHTPIDAISVRELLVSRLSDLVIEGRMSADWASGWHARLALDELERFGVGTVGELDALIPPELVDRVRQYHGDTSLVSIVRDLLMIHDARRYFDKVYEGTWNVIGQSSVEFLRSYGVDISVMQDHNIHVDPEDGS